SLTITVIVTPPPVPGAPDLLATSDSGRSNTDDVTFATAPVFNVAPAVATDTVQLLRNGVVVATRTGPGQVTDPGPVADGTYSYTARQAALAGNLTPQSPALWVTIDTTPPAQPAPPAPQPGSITGPNNTTSVNNPTFDTVQTEP